VPFTTLINRADPDFLAGSSRELEYSFQRPGRKMYGNPRTRGAYH
jgi:hypothetical protein